MKERISLKKDYIEFALKLCNKISSEWKKDKLVIGITGESGSGKSVTGLGLKEAFQTKGLEVAYLQMDDYFHLPPLTNHQNRLKSLDNIGPQEVDLQELDRHIDSFFKDEETLGRECVFSENQFLEKTISFKDKKVLIVEGTYIGELDKLDVLVFIDRDYKETLKNRMERGREAFDPFIEKVLDIEHNIIKEYKSHSDIVIDSNYNIEKNYA